MGKYRPFYTPREFSCVFVMAVYIPPHVEPALELLHSAINEPQNSSFESAFIVAGDFNQTNLRSVLPSFYHNVKCPAGAITH